MLEVLAVIVGRPVGPRTNEDEQLQMVVLGVEITTNYAVLGVQVARQDSNAKVLNNLLKAALERATFELAEAAHLAGQARKKYIMYTDVAGEVPHAESVLIGSGST